MIQVYSKHGFAPAAPSIHYVDYLESSGAQYIDTGFKPTSSARIICDFQMVSTKSVFQNVFGGRGSATGYAGRFSLTQNTDHVFRSDFNNANVLFTSAISPTGRHTADKNKNICIIDEEIVTNTDGTFTGAYPVYLFGQNTGGAATELADMRLWYCQIYDNDVLIRDYWPCLDDEGTACLYDRVNGEYVYNAGTGAFTTN